MRPVQRFIRSLSALAFTAVLILGILPTALAQQGNTGGIGVDNDGPSFIDVSITEDNYYKYVDVQVRDLNGWNDIFSVNVTIMGTGESILSQVCYMQYPSLSSTTVATIIWNRTAGDQFVEAASGWALLAVPPWNPDNAVMEIGLRVSFAFNKFSGDKVNIFVMDKGMLTCEVDVPFSAEYIPAPEWENVAIPISLSTIVAVAAAGFMAYRRFKNNKLAKAVEASHMASAEE